MYVKKKTRVLRDLLKFQKDNKLEDLNYLELILAYCEEKDIDVVEIGEMIKKDSLFTELFRNELENNFLIKKTDGKNNFVQEWI